MHEKYGRVLLCWFAGSQKVNGCRQHIKVSFELVVLATLVLPLVPRVPLTLAPFVWFVVFILPLHSVSGLLIVPLVPIGVVVIVLPVPLFVPFVPFVIAVRPSLVLLCIIVLPVLVSSAVAFMESVSSPLADIALLAVSNVLVLPVLSHVLVGCGAGACYVPSIGAILMGTRLYVHTY